MKEFDNIDTLFQDAFDGFEALPDPNLKALIDKQINQSNGTKLFLSWFFPVLLVLGTVSYFTFAIPSEKKKNDLNEREIGDQTQSNSQISKLESKKSLLSQNSSVQNSNSKSDNTKIIIQDSEKSFNYNTKLKSKVGNTTKMHTQKTTSNSDLSLKSAFRDLKAQELKTPLLNEEFERNQGDDRSISNRNSDLMGNREVGSLVITDVSAIFNNNELQLLGNVSNSSRAVTTSKNKTTFSLQPILGFESGRLNKEVPESVTGALQVKNEFANLRIQSFYGKFEVGTSFFRRFIACDVFTGIGYKSLQVTQKGARFDLDSSANSSGLSPGGTWDYFATKSTGQQKFTVNSIIVPIGLSYDLILSERLIWTQNGIWEMSFGNFRQIENNPMFTNPKFNKVALQVGWRSQLHFKLNTQNNISLFAFGSADYIVKQHVTWDFVVQTPYLFGGGVGVKYIF